jgi:hypothetical protein
MCFVFRLSSAIPNNLTNSSCSKTNLDEISRPTQLADMYSKLINTEWSDSLHLLTLEMKDEKTVIQCLLEILMVDYHLNIKTYLHSCNHLQYAHIFIPT